MKSSSTRGWKVFPQPGYTKTCCCCQLNSTTHCHVPCNATHTHTHTNACTTQQQLFGEHGRHLLPMFCPGNLHRSTSAHLRRPPRSLRRAFGTRFSRVLHGVLREDASESSLRTQVERCRHVAAPGDPRAAKLNGKEASKHGVGPQTRATLTFSGACEGVAMLPFVYRPPMLVASSRSLYPRRLIGNSIPCC